MNLLELLEKHRSGILRSWFDLVVDTYHPDTAQFIRRQKDQFANPVGASIREGLEGLLSCFIQGADLEALTPHLDRIVRIRVLQKFTPSQSLGFIPGLKGILREKLAKEKTDPSLGRELEDFENLLDTVLFKAFDLYAGCLTSLSDIRLKDERRRVHLLLRRANMLNENAEVEIDLPNLHQGGHETNNDAR